MEGRSKLGFMALVFGLWITSISVHYYEFKKLDERVRLLEQAVVIQQATISEHLDIIEQHGALIKQLFNLRQTAPAPDYKKQRGLITI